MIIDNTLKLLLNKKYIVDTVNYLCNELKIKTPSITFQDIKNKDAIFSMDDKTLIININLLQQTKSYKNFTNKEIKYLMDNAIYHEIEHVKQYYDYLKNKKITPLSLGIEQPIIIKSTQYSYNKMKLYISSNPNPFLYNVYVLQPNEYSAFTRGINVLKEKGCDKLPQLHIVDNAIKFIQDKFKIDNPVKEVSNALMNLYDNGNRECSEEIQDLVVRCAICSYYDKEDYGVDKVSILLGENYEKKISTVKEPNHYQ